MSNGQREENLEGRQPTPWPFRIYGASGATITGRSAQGASPKVVIGRYSVMGRYHPEGWEQPRPGAAAAPEQQPARTPQKSRDPERPGKK
ncbi:hypothetical protein MTO96_029856 [Rhipicephalus appendiculatus]